MVSDNTVRLADFIDFPPFESITKARRNIQNYLGLYPPSPEVAARRSKRNKEIYSREGKELKQDSLLN